MTTDIADLAALAATDSAIPEDTEIPATPDIACEVCGADITALWSGRGRKPKRCAEHKTSRTASNIGSRPRGNADVQAAVNNLEMAYNALGMGLMLIGARESAATLSESIPALSAQNASFLAQDKELTKRINSIGKAGGRAGFFAAQVMTLGPVLVLAYQELSAKRENKSETDEVPFAAFAEGTNG